MNDLTLKLSEEERVCLKTMKESKSYEEKYKEYKKKCRDLEKQIKELGKGNSGFEDLKEQNRSLANALEIMEESLSK